jgi:hypothetical protein
VRSSGLSAREKSGEKRGGNFGHITGYDQIPFLVCGSKSGVNTGKGASRRIYISNNRITKVTISLRIADQNHVTHGLMYLSGNMFNQRGSFERQQSLVETHAGTPAARQHESRAIHRGNDNIIRMQNGVSYVAEK